MARLFVHGGLLARPARTAAESAGGAPIAAGLLTWPAAACVLFTMLVAALSAKAGAFAEKEREGRRSCSGPSC